MKVTNCIIFALRVIGLVKGKDPSYYMAEELLSQRKNFLKLLAWWI